jgi:hypothetical protein
MLFSGLRISVSGCDNILQKKIELYWDKYPDVQLFFTHKPDRTASLCVLPAALLPRYLNEDTQNFISAPVLAYGPPEAIALSFASGCCDYLCTPWTPVELFERIRRCLKLAALVFDDYRFIPESGMLYCVNLNSTASVSVRLTHREEAVFKILTRNRGRYFDRNLLCDLLQLNVSDESRAVDMLVSRLRTKILTLSLNAGIKPAGGLIRTSSGRGWAIL